jgi:tetratricopeptide (TPR) repeat protein
LEIGKPLDFSKNEKHSFQEWLQLSKIQPIAREEKVEEVENPSEAEIEKRKKNELIDKFIETSPKIPPIKNDIIISNIIFEPSNADNSYIMTETLARVYLEQKKYQKAIQAYEILILKYPEKSSFFADRILDIKNLQQNNK